MVADKPQSFEQLSQPYGFVLYETTLLSPTNGKIKLVGLQDLAHVYVNSKFVGVVERRLGQTELPISAPAGSQLRILVENQGRVNFSRVLLNEHKGLRGAVLDGAELLRWRMYSLPFERPDQYRYKSTSEGFGPILTKGHFSLGSVADTYLDMRGWGHGAVWVNGHNLGRYWKIGPQQTLYVPASWLRRGTNNVIVLDADPTDHRSITGLADPVFGRG